MPPEERGTETSRGRQTKKRDRGGTNTSQSRAPSAEKDSRSARSVSSASDYGQGSSSTGPPSLNFKPFDASDQIPAPRQGGLISDDRHLSISPLAKRLLNLNVEDATSGRGRVVQRAPSTSSTASSASNPSLSSPHSRSRPRSDLNASAGLDFFEFANAERDRLQLLLNQSVGPSHGRSQSAPPPSRPSTQLAPRSLSVPRNGSSESAFPMHMPGAPQGTPRGGSPMYLPSRPATPDSTMSVRLTPSPTRSPGPRQASTALVLRERSTTPLFTTELKNFIEAAQSSSSSASSSASGPPRQGSPKAGHTRQTSQAPGPPASDENRGRSTVPGPHALKRLRQPSPLKPQKTTRRSSGRQYQ